MTVILVNCVTLGMYEPCPAEKELVCDRNCQILKVYKRLKGLYNERRGRICTPKACTAERVMTGELSLGQDMPVPGQERIDPDRR